MYTAPAMSNKVIINQFIGGLSSITTFTVPEAASPGEIVVFGQSANEIAGSGVFVDAQRNVAPVSSISLDNQTANPAGANALWVGNDSKVYLGADAIGPISLGPVGAAPNANAATLAAGVLALQPADATNPGVITAAAQTIAGEKTFVDDIIAQKCVDLPATTGADVGCLRINNEPVFHSYANFTNTFAGSNSCIGNTPAPASENTTVGNSAGRNLRGAAQANTALGSQAAENVLTAVGNVAVGSQSLRLCATGDHNTAMGRVALVNCLGARNIGVGYLAGNDIVAVDDTISIGSAGLNTSGSIVIGTLGTHTSIRIAGVGGSPGGAPTAVLINPANGRLGSTEAAIITRNTTSYTPTLNGGGAITTMTGHTGAASTTIPVVYTRIGPIVHANIARFGVTAFTGAPNTIIIGTVPSDFRPTNAMMTPVTLYNATNSYASGFVDVNASGVMSMSLVAFVTFTATFGAFRDLDVSWAII